MVEYEDWGVNREAGGGVNQATEDRGPSRGPARPEDALGRSGWSHPVGGTEASGTLHSTLKPLNGVSQEVQENDLQTDPENHLHPAPPQHPYYHTLPPHSDE